MPSINKIIAHNIDSDTEDVLLTVLIGDDQPVYNIIVTFADDRPDHEGATTALSLGQGASLKNKRTRLFIRVTDTNQKTDWTSVTISLTNASKSQQLKGQSEGDGSTVLYNVIIDHK